MLIHRLENKAVAARRFADLTCDSDGKVDLFINNRRDVEARARAAPVKSRTVIGIFTVGACPGSSATCNNLFGDTDAVHVRLGENDRIEDRAPRRGRLGRGGARLRSTEGRAGRARATRSRSRCAKRIVESRRGCAAATSRGCRATRISGRGLDQPDHGAAEPRCGWVSRTGHPLRALLAGLCLADRRRFRRPVTNDEDPARRLCACRGATQPAVNVSRRTGASAVQRVRSADQFFND